MKKITFLTILLSAIVFGIVGLVSEIRAEKGGKVSIQKTEQPQKKDALQGRETVFSNFTAYGCFEENDELIGRDIQFRLNGVNVNVKLLKLNKTTREFNANFVKGTFYQNKVEVKVTPDEINDQLVRYTADNVEKSKDKILLKGNAILTSNQKDSIKTDEIIISLKQSGKYRIEVLPFEDLNGHQKSQNASLFKTSFTQDTSVEKIMEQKPTSLPHYLINEVGVVI